MLMKLFGKLQIDLEQKSHIYVIPINLAIEQMEIVEHVWLKLKENVCWQHLVLESQLIV